MGENEQFDINLRAIVDSKDLNDLEKRIKEMEDKKVTISTNENISIKRNNRVVQDIDEINELHKIFLETLNLPEGENKRKMSVSADTYVYLDNESINLDQADKLLNLLKKFIKTTQAMPDLLEKGINIDVNVKGFDQELSKGLIELGKIKPNIEIDQDTIKHKFEEAKEKYAEYRGDFLNNIKALTSEDWFQEKGQLGEAVDYILKSIKDLSRTRSVLSRYAKQGEYSESDLEKAFLGDSSSFIKDTLANAKDEALEYYKTLGGEQEKFEKQWNRIPKTFASSRNTSNTVSAKEILKAAAAGVELDNEARAAAVSVEGLNQKAQEAGVDTEKAFKRLDVLVAAMSNQVSKFLAYYKKMYEPMNSSLEVILNTITEVKTALSELPKIQNPFNEAAMSEGATALKNLFEEYQKLTDKTLSVSIDIPKAQEIIKFVSPITQYGEAVLNLAKAREKYAKTDSKNIKPPTESEVQAIKNFGELYQEVGSDEYRIAFVLEGLDNLLRASKAIKDIADNKEALERTIVESMPRPASNVQSSEHHDTAPGDNAGITGLVNHISDSVDSIKAVLDQPITVELDDKDQVYRVRVENSDELNAGLNNQPTVNEVFYKTQIATLADSINKSIANANNKDNYADVIGKKLDNIIAQLGKTFKTEVTNFSTLVNSSGGLLTQAQLAQLMQLLQKNQPTIVNSGASKTQDNTVGGIENAASDRQRAFEISSTVKENYDLFEFLDKSLKETNSQLPHTTAGFNELYEQMRVIYSNIEDVVKKINKANLSEEKRKELMEELEEHNKSFGDWQKKNISDINTLLSYSRSLPATTIGNPVIVERTATLGQDITTYFDSVKEVFDSFEYIKRYFDNANVISQPIDDFEHKFNEILTFYTNAESMLKKVQRPNLSGNTVNQIEEDLYSQDQGFTDYLQKESYDVQTVSDLASLLREIISKSEEANEKLETLRSTIKEVEAAGGDTSNLKYLEDRLKKISDYSKNPRLVENPEVYKFMLDKAYEDYDNTNLTMFDFDDSNIEIDDFSKKVQKLKKLLKQLRDGGGEAQKILANIGNLDNNQLEALSNNFERDKNEYITNAASAQGNDARFLKEQYFGNSIQPLIEYVNRLDEVTEAVNNFTTAKKESNKATKEQEQADNAAIAFQKKYEETVKRLRKWGDDNSKALKDPYFAKAYEELTNRISVGAIQSDKDLNKLRADMSALDRTVKEAGVSGKTFGNVLGELYKKYGGWAFVTKSLNYTVRLLKDMVTQVHEVDTAMTNLRKVTDANERQLKQYLDTAGGRSVDIGATLTDYVDATSEFSRLGKSLNEAENLGKLATIYKTVGDDLDIQTASQSIISTMQAYEKIGVTAEEIVDKFNYTGNNFAITSKGVGDALQRSAASLNAAGNDLNESIGLITSANTIVQNTETVGTALKSISARIRGTTDQLGEDAEEMTITTAELRDKIKSITRIDIMQDENTFKSTYQILKEISEVYDTLTDSQQADIAEMLGGKVGLNTVQAILGNFETAEKVVEDLNEGLAEGSASKELESSLDSIDGKLNQLKSTWQQLSVDTVNSEAVKFLIDGAKTLLELLDGIAKNGAAAGAGIATAFGLTGLQMKTGSGRAKMFALNEYARVSSGGNTERVDIVFVISTRELWKNYRTWCIAQRVL